MRLDDNRLPTEILSIVSRSRSRVEVDNALLPLRHEFSEARARLGLDCCLECGRDEAAAEVTRRARMIVPISHKSGYTYLGPDRTTQRQRLLEGSAKTPPMEVGAQPIGRAATPREDRRRRYEFAGWEFKPDKQGIRRKRAILRERSSRE